MGKCKHHPGRPSAVVVGGEEYCSDCDSGIIAARKAVDKHVEPKLCFVWYKSAGNWQPIEGTGCAHWVAHQRGIRRGKSMDRCAEGYTYRVRTLIQGMQPVEFSNVQINDIYVNPELNHTGLVVSVVPNADSSKSPSITIRHDSSGQRRVVDNDFSTYFSGRGSFYR